MVKTNWVSNFLQQVGDLFPATEQADLRKVDGNLHGSSTDQIAQPNDFLRCFEIMNEPGRGGLRPTFKPTSLLAGGGKTGDDSAPRYVIPMVGEINGKPNDKLVVRLANLSLEAVMTSAPSSPLIIPTIYRDDISIPPTADQVEALRIADEVLDDAKSQKRKAERTASRSISGAITAEIAAAKAEDRKPKTISFSDEMQAAIDEANTVVQHAEEERKKCPAANPSTYRITMVPKIGMVPKEEALIDGEKTQVVPKENMDDVLLYAVLAKKAGLSPFMGDIQPHQVGYLLDEKGEPIRYEGTVTFGSGENKREIKNPRQMVMFDLNSASVDPRLTKTLKVMGNLEEFLEGKGFGPSPEISLNGKDSQLSTQLLLGQAANNVHKLAGKLKEDLAASPVTEEKSEFYNQVTQAIAENLKPASPSDPEKSTGGSPPTKQTGHTAEPDKTKAVDELQV